MREVIADTDGYGYLLHHRDSIFAKHLDDSIRALGLAVLRSPFASPKANSICERVIGTIRRECLDWVIPLSGPHLRSILHEWVSHYNGGRPLTARWARACRALLLARCGDPKPKLGIDGCRARACAQSPCWADCTTSIRWLSWRRPCSRYPRSDEPSPRSAERPSQLIEARFCGAQLFAAPSRCSPTSCATPIA
ncbi:integrase core domain-containing protein [Variovorax humicola]|uniref:integrase core domain-containing protein n=1 Tax=Variovorax humicola TaxID=1769758 RepID=UPI003BF5287A